MEAAKMTGEKNRFKTTEKLWDLDDKQLKSPKHDAMVLWLMNKVNIHKFNLFEDKVKLEPHKAYGNYVDAYLHDYIVESEVPIMSSKTFIAGYGDLVIYAAYKLKYNDKEEVHHNVNSCLIEVKPYVDSFGAVLRQIKSYRKFSHYNKYVLFSLDNRFDTQFESQGIKVIHPDVSIDDMLMKYGLY